MDGLILVYAEDVPHFLKQNSFHSLPTPILFPLGLWIKWNLDLCSKTAVETFWRRGWVVAGEIQGAKYFKGHTDAKERPGSDPNDNTVSNKKLDGQLSN